MISKYLCLSLQVDHFNAVLENYPFMRRTMESVAAERCSSSRHNLTVLSSLCISVFVFFCLCVSVYLSVAVSKVFCEFSVRAHNVLTVDTIMTIFIQTYKYVVRLS